jgi:RNA polymerase sigma-70 factor (ECF subfamily)
MVEMRLDWRLQARLDASDVIQDAFLDVAGRLLSLRHFEQLNRAETAQVLGVSEAAAAKRYLRALDRLKDALADMPGGLEGL